MIFVNSLKIAHAFRLKFIIDELSYMITDLLLDWQSYECVHVNLHWNENKSWKIGLLSANHKEVIFSVIFR